MATMGLWRGVGGCPMMSMGKQLSMCLRSEAFCEVTRRFSTVQQPAPLRIALIGPPGSGKGTHAKKVHQDYGAIQYSTGDMLRAAAAEPTPLGQKLKDQLATGGLVSDELVLDLLQKALFSSESRQRGWVLDGFPRTVNQAQALDKMLSSQQQPLTHVLYIKVDAHEVAERIKGRLYHPPSGRVYHISYSPPKVPGRDDVTGEPLVSREDDKPETVIARLQAYDQKTKPLLDYYSDVLITIEKPTSKEGYVVIRQILDDFKQKQERKHH